MSTMIKGNIDFYVSTYAGKITKVYKYSFIGEGFCWLFYT